MHLYNAWLPPHVAEETKKEKESFARVVRTVNELYRPDDPDSVYATLTWIPVIKLLVFNFSFLGFFFCFGVSSFFLSMWCPFCMSYFDFNCWFLINAFEFQFLFWVLNLVLSLFVWSLIFKLWNVCAKSNSLNHCCNK